MNDFQEQMGKLLNLDQLQDAVKDMYDTEGLMQKIRENVNVASKLIEANTAAATDAAILQSTKLRDGIEGALEQANALSQCKDLEAAIESQKEYGAKTKDALIDQAWMNIGMAVSALETNIDILKSAVDKK